MTAEIIVPVGLLLLFIALGIYLLQGKGGWLIAGYNTMPKEDKEKYDEAALCKATGKLVLAIAFTIALITAGGLLEMNSLMISGVVLMLVFILFGVIYINTGSALKKAETEPFYIKDFKDSCCLLLIQKNRQSSRLHCFCTIKIYKDSEGKTFSIIRKPASFISCSIPAKEILGALWDDSFFGSSSIQIK